MFLDSLSMICLLEKFSKYGDICFGLFCISEATGGCVGYPGGAGK